MNGARPLVGHTIGEYLPRSATFVHTLVRFQRRHPRVVLAGRTANLAEFPLDAPVVQLAAPASAPARAMRRLAAYARRAPTVYGDRIAREAARRGCGLLHAHWGDMGWTTLHAKRRLGVPLVTTFYGYDLELADWKPAWRRRLDDLFAEGEAFCCEGPFMARRLAALGAPAGRVHVVPIGLDLQRIPFRARRPARPLIVLQCARFEEKKGLDLSIRAFAAAQREVGAAELWLVGDGVERARLEALARELGVSEAVRFHGLLSYERYAEALARAHVGIHPSRVASDGNSEGGAPTVLLEMQASGMPVVATAHADIPAVVPEPDRLAAEEDVDALAAALVELAGAPDGEWRRRAAAGRALIEERHDAGKVAGQVEALYAALVGG